LIEVRKGRLDDVLSIVRLIENESGKIFDLDKITSYLKQFPSSVAVVNEVIVGFCYTSPFAPDILEILNILVARKYQKLEIGSKLLRSVERDDSSYTSIILVNSLLYKSSTPKRSAEDFYAKNGFKVIHRTQNTNVFIKDI
jgi:N-acetylglutamate synthase-like GNAT family acetyltransferase